jgi:ABC-type transport system involved in multi-copper enzyme maturation permease subunit
MNSTIFVTTLRQRFSSRTRLLLVAAVFFLPIGFSALARELGTQAARSGVAFAFLLGAGILGQETASGVYQLLFVRPIRRWEYVVSRWLAVVAGASALTLLQLALICLVVASHGLPSTRELMVQATEQVLAVIGIASVILLYSSFLTGVGDVLGIVLTFISAQILGAIGQFRQSDVLIRTGAEVLRFVNPEVAIGPMTVGGGIPWFDLVSYLSTVTLCLAVAVWVLNRREISYASE